MVADAVLWARDGDIATITLNRPQRRNAVDRTTAQALREAFERFEADASLSIAILTGACGQFCAGADLQAMDNEVEPTGSAPGPMGPTRMVLGKPVIAAIEGHAVAGGLELALLCDLRVAARDATLGVFCRRFGVPLIDGGTVRLPRLIGQSRALDLILTGRAVSAEEALTMGLVNRMVEPGLSLVTAQALARELAALPQACLRADRASTLAQWDWPLDEALRREGAGGFPVIEAEARVGAARFAAGAGRHGARDR